MLAFLIQRVLQAIFVMFVVALIAFSLFHYVGDPVLNMLGQEATEADRAALRAQLGLDQPVVVQFWHFIVNAAQFEFGISYRSARPVTDMILERLPATLELAIISAIFAVVMGIALGIYTALRRRSWLAHFIMTTSLIGVSLPTFLIGVLLIYVFAVELGWLPAFGRGQTVRHALKNTMIPVITIIGLQLGTIIAFAIITETVFQWPGVGALFITAVRFVDIPVMAAYLMMIGLVFVVINPVLGTALGLSAGFRGGWRDALIMRIADVQLTFPSILMALLIFGVIRGFLPRSMHAEVAIIVLIIAIGLSDWVQYARAVRGATMVEKSKEYVQAARVIGLPARKILVQHILPNVMRPVLVIGTIGLALAIIAEATLSFLGVGMPATQPSLGTLIRVGQDYMFSGEWWILLFPGMALLMLALSVNLLGDWLRDVLNPKLR